MCAEQRGVQHHTAVGALGTTSRGQAQGWLPHLDQHLQVGLVRQRDQGAATSGAHCTTQDTILIKSAPQHP